MLVVALLASAQIPTNDLEAMGATKKAKPAPLNADLPFLECPVCQKVAVEALRQVRNILDAAPAAKASKRRFESSSSLGSTESETEEVLLKICNPENDGLKEYGKPQRSASGKWISELDVVKQGTALALKPMGEGHCRRECRTIAKSCEQVLSRLSDGDDDLGEYLLSAAKSQLSEGVVSQHVCAKMAGVCKKSKLRSWPEGKPRKNEQFKPKDAQDHKLQEALATMAGENGNGISIMQPGDYDLPGDDSAKLRKVDPIDVLHDEL